MRYWVQYHNYEKLGQLPGEGCGISTDKQEVLDTLGDTIFLIVGISENPSICCGSGSSVMKC